VKAQHLNTVRSFIYLHTTCRSHHEAETQVRNWESLLWKRPLHNDLDIIYKIHKLS